MHEKDASFTGIPVSPLTHAGLTRVPEHYFKATDEEKAEFQGFITSYQDKIVRLKRDNSNPDYITFAAKSTAIDMVLSMVRSQNSLIRSKETIQHLFHVQGFDINQGPYSENDTNNALARITDYGDTHLMDLLIDCGANIHHIVTCTQLTPLMTAVKGGKKEVVQYLLYKGANPNQVIPTYNTTALAYALLGGHEEIAQLLLAKGADFNLLKDIRVQVACLDRPETESSQIFSNIHALADYTAQRGSIYANVTRLLVDHGAQIAMQNKVRLFAAEHKASIYTLSIAIAATGMYQLYKWGSWYYFSH
jgi:hypothetical protein